MDYAFGMANIVQTCGQCNRQFLVIDQEQKFLQEKMLPLPSNCPACRQDRRLQLRGNRKLYKSTCQKCGKEIVVSFDPQNVQQQILCRRDYDQYWMDTEPIIDDPLPEAL